jgi:hypothetical protein
MARRVSFAVGSLRGFISQSFAGRCDFISLLLMQQVCHRAKRFATHLPLAPLALLGRAGMCVRRRAAVWHTGHFYRLGKNAPFARQISPRPGLTLSRTPIYEGKPAVFARPPWARP